MLDFTEEFTDNGHQRAWFQSKKRQGLYILDNPFALKDELWEELQNNLQRQHDFIYKSPNGWTYKVKIDDNDQIGLLGWRSDGSSKQQSSSKSSSSKPKPKGQQAITGYTGKPLPAAVKEKKYVDVEVKYSDNPSTINEILSNGYMNGEIWRLQDIKGMIGLDADNNPVETTQFIVVRSKEYTDNPKPKPKENSPDEDMDQEQGMDEEPN